MSKRKNKLNQFRQNQQEEEIHLTFGDPEPVLDRVTSCLGTFFNDHQDFYQPPVDFKGLAKMSKANSHHGTCLIFRRNMLTNDYLPNGFLTRSDFKKAQTDYLTFGNAFLQVIRNGFGQALRLQHLPAVNMRRGKNGRFFMLMKNFEKVKFRKDEVLHLMEYDTAQGIYGLPDWLGGMQSVLLNEDATLFRRKYYKNGAHLGYIMYTNDAKMSEKVRKAITEKVAQGKGAGNFKSMHLHVPNGNEKAVQILPIGDINQKDEFERIKNISADDVIVAHRVHPALVAVKPSAQSNFGDPEKIEAVYRRTELEAMKQPWLELNEQLPAHMQIRFKQAEEKKEK